MAKLFNNRYYRSILMMLIINYLILTNVYVKSTTALNTNQNIVHEPKDVAVRDHLLLISTLDGSFHAVSQRNGLLKWSITNSPILQMSPMINLTNNDQQQPHNFLLPDPKDGTLYLFNGFGGSSENNKHSFRRTTLEKLPITIKELVSTSPCRSSDGMIYTSKKTDEWIIIDIENGQKIGSINVDSPVCSTPDDRILPATHNLLHLFKSEYQISIFNGENREKIFNFTYVDYSPSMVSSISQNSYEFLHLTSSSDGKIATMDVADGHNSFLWSFEFDSPIISIYRLSETANFPIIHRVPFFTIGGFLNATSFFHPKPALFPSVYVGELSESKSLYALSALVETTQIRKDLDYLLEGPLPPGEYDEPFDLLKYLRGYYEYPKESDIKFSVIPRSHLLSNVPYMAVDSGRSNVIQDRLLLQDLSTANVDRRLPVDNGNNSNDAMQNYTFWMLNLIVLLISMIILAILSIFVMFYMEKRNQHQQAKTISSSSSSSSTLKTMSTNDNNRISIGKITFHSSDIIGRGCAGTCVYKGLFEGKQRVAVKRIVSDCFRLANREIDLLRQLQHPNLIRYFATESDEQFTYIAIELAEMTLSDYIIESKQGTIDFRLDKINLMHQTCQGLQHLHSLDIVHRDIKPANILISSNRIDSGPARKANKIMITDFGLSKILTSESFTTADNRSAGTEGWIAPEMLKRKLYNTNNTDDDKEKPSKPNDIFSLGCLLYYTHTDGEHPFGELDRQTAILKGEANLTRLNGEEHICLRSLVEPMIDSAASNRPSIETILKHPYFWNEQQSLQFMQDVSDRFECEQSDSPLLRTLEQGSLDVCRGDWRRCISFELQEDLRKFRSYKGQSVRDLLRAIRNKRHHYHELDASVQRSLGSIPNEFTKYFTSRFPRLIIHSYIALQSCSNEDVFRHYYHQHHQSQSSNDASSPTFQFKTLPRATVRWNERWKDDDQGGGGAQRPFAFNVRQRKQSKQSTSSSTNNNSNSNSPPPPTNGIQTIKEQDIRIEQRTLDDNDSHFYNDVFKM